jgi:D-lactate dehydrogenase (cytochrome)
VDIAALVQQHRTILPVGAQSSVTGGATPFGEVVLSTASMTAIRQVDHGRVRAQAGVLLGTLQAALARDGRYYPPVPSYTGPSVGGVLATNAAGPATFKYGSTRDWVDALTVVLATGEVLDMERGQCVAHADGYFEIDGPSGTRRVPIPTYHMPDVAKRSAGYFAAPQMDLVDLFVGAEGTLGIITAATLRVVAPAPRVCVASIACGSDAQALALTARLRDVSTETRRTRDAHGIDVSAIEYLDRRSLDLLRAHNTIRDVTIMPQANALLLVQVELSPHAASAPLTQLRHLLAEAGVLDQSVIVPADDHARAEQILAVRAAVPQEVNARIAQAQREISPKITKVGADMIVPFAHTGAMIALFRDRFERLGMDYAIWGHVSDGNLHPNALPQSEAGTNAAQAIVLEIGGIVTNDLGGCPLAEHGVGRNPIKQALLRQLYGVVGIEQMRAVKQALDPEWKLAPGNVFPAPPR